MYKRQGGATFEDVALMKAHMGEGKKIKAAGGISGFADAEKFLSLGADRLGTSRLVDVYKRQGLGSFVHAENDGGAYDGKRVH